MNLREAVKKILIREISSKIVDRLIQKWTQGTNIDSSTVKDYIDPNQVHPLWNAYNKITGNNGAAPCTCNPRKWIDAVNEIRNFISQNG